MRRHVSAEVWNEHTATRRLRDKLEANDSRSESEGCMIEHDGQEKPKLLADWWDDDMEAFRDG